MNRREFSVRMAGVAAVAAIGLPDMVFAQVKTPQNGVEYTALERRAPVEAPRGKVEAIEFFWYACPHCNAFEPTFEAWAKRQPADVAVRRVPVAFRDDFVPLQRLYYTLEALGKVDELHAKVFHTIHVEHQPLDREELIVAWAGKQGLDPAKVKELYNSFTVSTKARRATQLQNDYKVEGVPAIGVGGRFYTDGTMAGNMERTLQVTDYLIAQVRKNP
jgi:protein dithiol oxidoreductase (disulfide-forming)